MTMGRTDDESKREPLSPPSELTWRSAGFTPADALLWDAAGFDPASAHEWRHQKFDVNDAHAWRKVIVELRLANDGEAVFATMLRDQGWTPQTLRRPGD